MKMVLSAPLLRNSITNCAIYEKKLPEEIILLNWPLGKRENGRQAIEM